ncbi:hypothetical protein [Magnetofaba australis]|uniref:hypothetical protein n=1 Tax=Magnetofaba australis TaxID=1472297 RepID=UPI000A19F0BA|nr:hypothetical protein [Magnetofaba australis]
MFRLPDFSLLSSLPNIGALYNSNKLRPEDMTWENLSLALLFVLALVVGLPIILAIIVAAYKTVRGEEGPSRASETPHAPPQNRRTAQAKRKRKRKRKR